jgi:hypothetical protein
MNKKINISMALSGIIAILLILTAVNAHAAGTVTQKLNKYQNGNLKTLVFSWTADAAAATIPSTDTTTAINAEIGGWYVYAIETDPDGTAVPTASYDIVINNASGRDIAGGMLANRSNSSTELVIPCLDSTNHIYGGVLVDSTLTLVISNNLVNSAKGTVKLFLAK